MITVTASPDQVVGSFKSKCRYATDVQIGARGPIAAQYHFAQKCHELVAALQALQNVPCDVSVSVTISSGTTSVTGHIITYVADAYGIAKYAAANAEAAALIAKSLVGDSNTRITITQTWDKTY